jgi:hypothetical protein
MLWPVYQLEANNIYIYTPCMKRDITKIGNKSVSTQKSPFMAQLDHEVSWLLFLVLTFKTMCEMRQC